jgi:2,4-dienoyl-CoA reductase-like NADH-dependent reductase (Old Yellow Enzyme family)/thioredoxin reductase
MVRRLLEPCTLGPLSLRNRIVFAPITTQFADARGYVTPRLAAHYEARARGGAGLVIVEATYIDAAGQAVTNQLAIHRDEYLPGLRQLADAIRRHGSTSALQIYHGGRMARSSLTGRQPVAPSAIPSPGGETPRELSKEEIRAIVRSFGAAAARAREAGFDAVEVLGSHTYLVGSFISPASNTRTDDYGGIVANRARFLLEILHEIQKTAGQDFPIWVKINAREFGVLAGLALEDAVEVARLTERAGSRAVHVSGFGPASPTNRTTSVFRPAVIAHLAAAVKQAVSIPVIAVGRITPEAGEELIENGSADLVALGKALLADPDLPAKLAAGEDDHIVPCIVCMHCYDTLISPGTDGIACQVNPRLGRDHEPQPCPAAPAKRVLVVGGGPAGMVAALTAARRGHAVTLWERSNRLGGQLIPAASPPHKDRISAYTGYLVRELPRAGICIELDHPATEDAIHAFRPDAVVIAVGAKPIKPDIPGIETAESVDAVAVLRGEVQVGRRAVIVGGGQVGCETAEVLVERGRQVTVTKRGSEMATGVGPLLRQYFLDRLREKGVQFLPGVRYVSARPGCLTVQTADGALLPLEVDTIVTAVGFAADPRLYHSLEGSVPEVYLIGDCASPRSIVDAVREGYDVGTRI